MNNTLWAAEIENDASLLHYLKTLDRTRSLSREDHDRLAARILRRDRKAVEMVVAAHRGLVVDIARDLVTRQRHRVLGAMDLIAEGNIALLATARRVTEWQHRDFAQVASGHVRARMLTALAEEASRLMGARARGGLPFLEYQTLVGFIADRDLAAEEARATRRRAEERRQAVKAAAGAQAIRGG